MNRLHDLRITSLLVAFVLGIMLIGGSANANFTFGEPANLKAVIPVIDLNSDGIVDAADVCIMVDHWHTDYPLCDVGPFAWGDGIVDVQDLIVLAEHLFEGTLPAETVE